MHPNLLDQNASKNFEKIKFFVLFKFEQGVTFKNDGQDFQIKVLKMRSFKEFRFQFCIN